METKTFPETYLASPVFLGKWVSDLAAGSEYYRLIDSITAVFPQQKVNNRVFLQKIFNFFIKHQSKKRLTQVFPFIAALAVLRDQLEEPTAPFLYGAPFLPFYGITRKGVRLEMPYASPIRHWINSFDQEREEVKKEFFQLLAAYGIRLSRYTLGLRVVSTQSGTHQKSFLGKARICNSELARLEQPVKLFRESHLEKELVNISPLEKQGIKRMYILLEKHGFTGQTSQSPSRNGRRGNSLLGRSLTLDVYNEKRAYEAKLLAEEWKCIICDKPVERNGSALQSGTRYLHFHCIKPHLAKLGFCSCDLLRYQSRNVVRKFLHEPVSLQKILPELLNEIINSEDLDQSERGAALLVICVIADISPESIFDSVLLMLRYYYTLKDSEAKSARLFELADEFGVKLHASMKKVS